MMNVLGLNAASLPTASHRTLIGHPHLFPSTDRPALTMKAEDFRPEVGRHHRRGFCHARPIDNDLPSRGSFFTRGRQPTTSITFHCRVCLPGLVAEVPARSPETVRFEPGTTVLPAAPATALSLTSVDGLGVRSGARPVTDPHLSRQTYQNGGEPMLSVGCALNERRLLGRYQNNGPNT
jgi:hypothetical protein